MGPGSVLCFVHEPQKLGFDKVRAVTARVVVISSRLCGLAHRCWLFDAGTRMPAQVCQDNWASMLSVATAHGEAEHESCARNTFRALADISTPFDALAGSLEQPPSILKMAASATLSHALTPPSSQLPNLFPLATPR